MSGKMGLLLVNRLRARAATEAPVQAGILAKLRALGIWVIRTGRYKRRSARDPMPECGEDGIPDLWTPYGWVETKAPSGELNPKQVEWHARARRHGIRTHVARSIEDGVKTVVDWRRCGR